MAIASGIVQIGTISPEVVTWSGEIFCYACKQLLHYNGAYVRVQSSGFHDHYCWNCTGLTEESKTDPFGCFHRKGDYNFLVAADWLEEHGYKEAAVQLRKVVN